MQYGQSFYKTTTLRAYAKAYLKMLPKDVDILISTGSSGCAIASAMLCLSTRPLRHIYIPKSKEIRHSTTDVSLRSQQFVAIVDDFICTGETIHRIIDILNSKFKVSGDKIYILTTSEQAEFSYIERKIDFYSYIQVEDIENNDFD